MWLYATLDGIGSARELARLCVQHAAYRWLCGGVGINYRTLSDFGVAHADWLDAQLVRGVTSLMAAGEVDLETVAQDGMRVRAAAGSSSFRRRPRLEMLRAEAVARVAALKKDLNTGPTRRSRRQAAVERAAGERRGGVGRDAGGGTAQAAQQGGSRQGAGVDHGRRGAGDENAGWRLPPSLQCAVCRRDAARLGRCSDGGDLGWRPGGARAGACDADRELWASAGQLLGGWRLRLTGRDRDADGAWQSHACAVDRLARQTR
ncbi:MAG: hypothetical protein ACREFJ_01500 [Acetobacteraceae bacterium]